MSGAGAGDTIRPTAEPGADDTILRSAARPQSRLAPDSATGPASTPQEAASADSRFIDAVPEDLGVRRAVGAGAGSCQADAVPEAAAGADAAAGGADDAVVAELRRAHREATATRSAASARAARSGQGRPDGGSEHRRSLRSAGRRSGRGRADRRRTERGLTGSVPRVRGQRGIALVAGGLSLVVCSAIAAVLLPQLGSTEHPADTVTEAATTPAAPEKEAPASATASATDVAATSAGSGAAPDQDPEAARAALAEPRAVVQSLADARTAHVVDGGPDMATVPGSAARSADDALAARLGGARVAGWRTTVTSAQLVEADYGAGEAVVRAVVSDSAWTGTTSSGRTERHDAVQNREITLRLRWHDGSWRIVEVV